jgi:hypothetical protein
MDAETPPRVQPGVSERLERLHAALEAVDASHRMRRHDRYEHDRGRNEDRGGDRPAEHQVDDQGERVQVHAADQHRRDSERAGVEGVRSFPEAQPQILGQPRDVPDAKDHDEVDGQDRVVERAGM